MRVESTLHFFGPVEESDIDPLEPAAPQAGIEPATHGLGIEPDVSDWC